MANTGKIFAAELQKNEDAKSFAQSISSTAIRSDQSGTYFLLREGLDSGFIAKTLNAEYSKLKNSNPPIFTTYGSDKLYIENNKQFRELMDDKLLTQQVIHAVGEKHRSLLPETKLPTAKDQASRDAELFKAIHASNVAGIQTALRERANPDAEDEHKCRPLFYVCARNNAALQALIDGKANINAILTEGGQQTALHIAAVNNNKKSMEILLKAGAKTDVKDKNGKTPREVAVQSGATPETLALFEEAEKTQATPRDEAAPPPHDPNKSQQWQMFGGIGAAVVGLLGGLASGMGWLPALLIAVVAGVAGTFGAGYAAEHLNQNTTPAPSTPAAAAGQDPKKPSPAQFKEIAVRAVSTLHKEAESLNQYDTSNDGKLSSDEMNHFIKDNPALSENEFKQALEAAINPAQEYRAHPQLPAAPKSRDKSL